MSKDGSGKDEEQLGFSPLLCNLRDLSLGPPDYQLPSRPHKLVEDHPPHSVDSGSDLECSTTSSVTGKESDVVVRHSESSDRRSDLFLFQGVDMVRSTEANAPRSSNVVHNLQSKPGSRPEGFGSAADIETADCGKIDTVEERGIVKTTEDDLSRIQPLRAKLKSDKLVSPKSKISTDYHPRPLFNMTKISNSWRLKSSMDFSDVELLFRDAGWFFENCADVHIIESSFNILVVRAMSIDAMKDNKNAYDTMLSFLANVHALLDDDKSSFENRDSLTVVSPQIPREKGVHLFRFRRVNNPNANTVWNNLFGGWPNFYYRLDYRLYNVCLP